MQPNHRVPPASTISRLRVRNKKNLLDLSSRKAGAVLSAGGPGRCLHHQFSTGGARPARISRPPRAPQRSAICTRSLAQQKGSDQQARFRHQRLFYSTNQINFRANTPRCTRSGWAPAMAFYGAIVTL
jgi:hypothetical protein